MGDFKKRLQNWWWYNKTYALIGLLAAAALTYMLWPAPKGTPPDYHIALVSTNAYSQEELNVMEQLFTALGTDQNGDGKVLVQLHWYRVDLADPSPNAGSDNYQKIASLDADLVGNVSGLLLLQDRAAFSSVVTVPMDERTAFLAEFPELTLTRRADAATAYQILFDAFLSR